MRTVPNPYPAKNSWNKITSFKYVDCLTTKRFSEAIPVRHDPDIEIDAEFIVAEPYSVMYQLDQGSERRLTVPKGFLSDGVSILGNSSATRNMLEASIIHDYLYVAWQYLEDPSMRKPKKRDQKFADELFYIALSEAGVASFNIGLVRFGISVGGWGYYKEKDPFTFVDLL